jgi:hypothetical protein
MMKGTGIGEIIFIFFMDSGLTFPSHTDILKLIESCSFTFESIEPLAM